MSQLFDFQDSDLTQYRELDPDELKARSDDAQSIIFVDGRLVMDSVPGRSHRSLFNRGTSKAANWLRSRLSPELRLNDGDDRWFDLYSKYLFGRIGNIVNQNTGETKQFVSFWGRGADYTNPAAKGPTDQIPACIQALKSLIDNDTIVVFGDGRCVLVGVLLAGGSTGETDQAVVDRTEQARAIHLATGDRKRELMKQHGVWATSKKNKWDQALIDKNLVAPGTEYWRMNSEDITQKSFLERLGESLARMLRII